jgi:hypothetical protein
MGLGSEVRDTGSVKNLFWIPDPGVKKAPDPGSGSATLLCTVLQCPRTHHTYMHHNTVCTYVADCKKPVFYFADMEAAWSPLNPSDRTISPLTWPSGPWQLGRHIFFFFLHCSMLSQSLRLATQRFLSLYSVNQAVKCLTSLAGHTAHKKGH